MADTGPLGATAAGQAMGAQQPQYATATFPGKGTSSVTQGPAVAESKASETSADARAAVVAVGAAGAGSVEQPNDPGHTASDEGESHLTADRAKGVITATSRGHVERAIFGGGALVVAAVDVTATASSDGAKGTPSYQLEVGQVSVNGTPVEVTDKGVVAQKAPVAGSDAAFKAVNEQLNQALTNAGLKVFLAAPQVKVDGATATVSVTGVHVLFNQPPTLGPSVPTQSVEYVLGEAYAFAFGVPATPETPVVTPPEGGGEIATPPAVEGTELGSSVGSVSTPSVATPSTPTATPRAGRHPGTRLAALPVVSRRERPTWLVVVYVIWQALVLATGASLLWWRRLQQAAEAGG